jgi:enediyne biosynthesis protein E4
MAHLGGKLGAALLDYDGDGRIDVFSGGGRAESDVNRFEAGRDFAAPAQLFWNRGAGWGAAEAGAFPVATVRAVATADLDRDGDLDVVLTQFGGPPVFLRNDQRSDVPWLAIDLVATRTARDAGGARVEVHTPRQVHVQTAAPAMGLFAQSSATLHFGLGDDARVRRVVVHWPSGVRQEERGLAINRRITITER